MKNLIKRLRHIAKLECVDYGLAPEDHASWQAADALEAQQAERDVEFNGCSALLNQAERSIENMEEQLATITAQRDLLKDLVKEVEGKYFAFLKEKDIDAEKFKAEGDMYGWNYHTGERSGAVWMHLFMTELLKAASLKGE